MTLTSGSELRLAGGDEVPAVRHVKTVATGDTMDSVHGCSVRTDDCCSQVLDKLAISSRLQALSSATASLSFMFVLTESHGNH